RAGAWSPSLFRYRKSSSSTPWGLHSGQGSSPFVKTPRSGFVLREARTPFVASLPVPWSCPLMPGPLGSCRPLPLSRDHDLAVPQKNVLVVPTGYSERSELLQVGPRVEMIVSGREPFPAPY